MTYFVDTKNLTQMLTERGLDIEDLALEANLTPRVVRRALAGKSIRQSAVSALAEALNVSPEWLLGSEELVQIS